jgi:hypothetical protein
MLLGFVHRDTGTYEDAVETRGTTELAISNVQEAVSQKGAGYRENRILSASGAASILASDSAHRHKEVSNLVFVARL